jgi:surface protein
MFSMFSGAEMANPDTSGWDTSAVTDMSSMFANSTAANPDTSGWNTSSVTNMSATFYKATSANPDISGWDVSSVQNARFMLDGVTLSTSEYDATLINWNAQMLQPGVTFTGGNSTYCSNAATNARANMINSDGWAISDGGKSCTDTPPPTVVSSAASNISDGGARLNGTADPNGASTSAWFEWGTNTGYGNATAPQTNVGSGTSPVSYYFNLGAQQCGTTYHFRAVAENSGGAAYGTDRSFTTTACPAPPPTVVSSPASSIGGNWARLNGTADPNGASTNGWFEWGTSVSYGNATAPRSNVGSGKSQKPYHFDLGALACGTTYHFRAVAQNTGGTGYGTDRSVTTAECDLGEVIFRAGFELD